MGRNAALAGEKASKSMATKTLMCCKVEFQLGSKKGFR
jgi:hypothetical protein